jgi:hypothetical protein
MKRPSHVRTGPSTVGTAAYPPQNCINFNSTCACTAAAAASAVTYTKRPSYVMTGTLTVGAAAFSSTDGADALPYSLKIPNITISQKGSKLKPQRIPAQGIKCDSYTLQPGGSISCSFKAQVFTFLEAPPPGSVRASVQLSGGFQSNKPFKIQTPLTAFEWPTSSSSSSGEGAVPADSNMRLTGADTAQQYLQDTMQSSGSSSSSSSNSVATVTNYFEPGDGRVLPQGVQGQQPAANSALEETARFTYVALIPDIPKELCSKPLQVRVPHPQGVCGGGGGGGGGERMRGRRGGGGAA